MILTGSFIHILPAPLVPLGYPVPQGELTQLHLDVQHQVVPNLEDTQHVPSAKSHCLHLSTNTGPL